ALVWTGPKKGDPSRNPDGYKGTPAQRMRQKDLRSLIREGGDAMCTEPGYQHLTNFQYVFSVAIWSMARSEGKNSRFAIQFIANRLFGRIPVRIEVEEMPEDLTTMSNSELLDRVDMLRALILQGAIDVESVPDPKPTETAALPEAGANPGGD